jgi:tellurite methyltransferase
MSLSSHVPFCIEISCMEGGPRKPDRQVWEERYATRRGGADTSEALHHPAVDVPSEFLVAHAELMRGRVLDVAAGGGRNALYLARRGCIVEAFDISFAGLRLACAAAKAEGLHVLTVQADLEEFPLPSERYDAAINIRYLQRSLFVPLQRAVRPGGFILFETFLVDQQVFCHPRNPDFLLQRGELRAAFSGCDILVYEEGLFQSAVSRPAYLARMLARRRAPHVA